MKVPTRILLFAIYFTLILFALVTIGFVYGTQLQILRIFVTFLNALPLVLCKLLQGLLSSGPLLAEEAAVHFLIIDAILLSPVLFVSAAPNLWHNRLCRIAVVIYFAAFAILTIAAAVWLTVDPSLLTG